MSLLAVQGGATGTGTVTLLAPVTNSNQTLTLPDVTDTVAGIAATQTLTNKTLTSPTLTTPILGTPTSGNLANCTGIPAPAALSTASGSAPSYSARAWVNFDGTGTVAIRASGNVSSITDNGTGDYTVNFTTAMPDVNYAGVWGGTGINAYPALGIGDITTTWVQTTYIRGRYFAAVTATDLASVNLAVFR